MQSVCGMNSINVYLKKTYFSIKYKKTNYLHSRMSGLNAKAVLSISVTSDLKLVIVQFPLTLLDV